MEVRKLRELYTSDRALWWRLKAAGFVLPAKQYFTRRYWQMMCKGLIKTLYVSDLTRTQLAMTRRIKKSTNKELLDKIHSLGAGKSYVDPHAKMYDRYYIVCVLWHIDPKYMFGLMEEVNNVLYKRKEDDAIITKMPKDIFTALMEAKNPDPKRRAVFGKATARAKEYKKRSLSAKN
eukprot:Mrub_12016.p2 GENE.Mrub_12016~~Mrub_12016.p2  ORF type:complete len:188 (-),score=56.97 Mrub_12016:20-550(-)